MARSIIAVLGSGDSLLEAEIKRRNFSIVQTLDTASETLRSLRTLVLVFSQQPENADIARAMLTRQLRRYLGPVLNSGGNIAIVTYSAEGEIAASHTLSNFRRPADLRIRVFNLGIQGREEEERNRVAEFARAHEAGAEPSDVAISGITDPIHMLLLSRAFSDFAEISVSPLTGGTADAVWKVHARDRGGFVCDPFAVKLAGRNKIAREIDTFSIFAGTRVPFPHRAPVAFDRCVQGDKQSLLVTMFVERAVRLDEYVQRISPRLSIAALFDGPLRTWRRHRSCRTLQLAGEYEARGRLFRPNSLMLRRAYDKACQQAADLPTPDDVRSALLAQPPMTVFITHSHGDLHVRNVYIRENGTDVILIDFAAANDDSPVSRDPTTLEVSLAFDCVGVQALPLSAEQIEQAFSPNALHRGLPAGEIDLRLDAIAAVRLHARETCNDAMEYDISLAISLFNAARRHCSPTAYIQAVELLKAHAIV